MSKTLSRGLARLVRGATVWMKPQRRAMACALLAERLAQRVTVSTSAGPLYFAASSARSLHDPHSLYESEPETIRWLDRLPPGETLWDIGANIGVYALYAAKVRNLRVLAFEPSAASYAALVRNIEINELGDRVAAYCLAFDAQNRLDYLHMAHTEAGHSMHAFGRSANSDGAFTPAFHQAVPGFAIDQFCTLFAPPPPDHIKLDVDGIESAILAGGADTLSRRVKSVLVEVAGDAGPGIRAVLDSLGFSEDASFAAEGAIRNVLFRRALVTAI
jgi:FkbM family methyltransferase